MCTKNTKSGYLSILSGQVGIVSYGACLGNHAQKEPSRYEEQKRRHV